MNTCYTPSAKLIWRVASFFSFAIRACCFSVYPLYTKPYGLCLVVFSTLGIRLDRKGSASKSLEICLLAAILLIAVFSVAEPSAAAYTLPFPISSPSSAPSPSSVSTPTATPSPTSTPSTYYDQVAVSCFVSNSYSISDFYSVDVL